MQVIKILKIVGILLAVIALGLAGLFVYASIDKTDKFYLTDAELLNPNYLYELEDKLRDKEPKYEILPDNTYELEDKLTKYKVLHDNPSVYIHRIKQGKGVVLAYRWYSNGDIFAIDDEKFEKITIWLSNAVLQNNMKVTFGDTSRIIGVYTKGSSAWPQAACSGYITSGELIINRSVSGYRVNISGQLLPTPSSISGKWCSPQKIDKEFIAKKIEHVNITTWLGKPGKHPYDETYR